MPIAPITCKICDETQPCTIGWELFEFPTKKGIVQYNICFNCQTAIKTMRLAN